MNLDTEAMPVGIIGSWRLTAWPRPSDGEAPFYPFGEAAAGLLTDAASANGGTLINAF